MKIMPPKVAGSMFDIEMTLHNKVKNITILGCVTIYRALGGGWTLQSRSYASPHYQISDQARKELRMLMNNVVRNLEMEIKQCI